MKIVPYTRLNKKNKSRVDAAISRYETRPKFAHHATISTKVIKLVRSIVTVCNPTAEVQLVLSGNKLRVTQIDLNR